MFRDHWFQSLWRVASVRILCLLLSVFDDFGERHSSLIFHLFCKCFVKMHLTVVGGCRMLVVGLVYIVFLWFRGLGRAKRKHILYFILVLYMFRDNWCESLWRVASVRILLILLSFFFNDFGERHSSLFLFRWCRCFVKMHLTVVGGCHCFVVDLFYNVFCKLSGSWKGQTVAYSVAYSCFIHVSRPFMLEFVEGCKC